MRDENILASDVKCKHRMFKFNCKFCNGCWEQVFLSGFQYHCSMNDNTHLLNVFESLYMKSNLLATRDEEPYVDAEYQFILKFIKGKELYDFENLYILAERISRKITDLIYIQENYLGKCEQKHLNLRLKYLEKKLKNKEAFNACRKQSNN